MILWKLLAGDDVVSEEYTEKHFSKDVATLVANCFKDSASPQAELRNIDCELVLLNALNKYQEKNLLTDLKGIEIFHDFFHAVEQQFPDEIDKEKVKEYQVFFSPDRYI